MDSYSLLDLLVHIRHFLLIFNLFFVVFLLELFYVILILLHLFVEPSFMLHFDVVFVKV